MGDQGETGEQGPVGERGDSGQRGVGGERGPKGDHGQHGDEGIQGKLGERGDKGQKGERGDTGDQGEPGKSSLLTRNISLSYLVLAIVASLILGVLGWNIAQNRAVIDDVHDQQVKIAALAKSTNSALCSFKADLQRRIDNSQKYIDDVKAGRRQIIATITIAELETSVANQRATIRGLAMLPCGGD